MMMMMIIIIIIIIMRIIMLYASICFKLTTPSSVSPGGAVPLSRESFNL
jgi:hypothetical protein